MFNLPSSPWTFDIPAAPPSVNHYWKANGKRRYISAEGVAFRALTLPLARQATGGLMLSTRLRLECLIAVRFADNRRRDLDNALKCVLDATAHALQFDDAQIDRLTIERIPVIKGAGGLTRVTLRRM